MKWGVADTRQHLIRNPVHNVFILPEQEQGSSICLTWKLILGDVVVRFIWNMMLLYLNSVTCGIKLYTEAESVRY